MGSIKSKKLIDDCIDAGAASIEILSRVGMIERDKGIDMVLDAYLTVKDILPEVKLEIVGGVKGSPFAMAYYHLALAARWGGRDLEEQKNLIAKAVRYSDKISQKEKYYIKLPEKDIIGNRSMARQECSIGCIKDRNASYSIMRH
jgi:glycosyltransferase involved in cell wall biosynthesis